MADSIANNTANHNQSSPGTWRQASRSGEDWASPLSSHFSTVWFELFYSSLNELHSGSNILHNYMTLKIY